MLLGPSKTKTIYLAKNVSSWKGFINVTIVFIN